MLTNVHVVASAAPHRSADRVRAASEDAFCADEGLGLFAVADGVGGGPAAGVASRTAIDALVAFFRSGALTEGLAPDLALMARAGEHCDARVRQVAGERAGCLGMCTTLTACLLCGSQAWFLHLGDSRAYRVRGEEIIQLTEDHSSETLFRDREAEMGGGPARRRVLLAALGSQIPMAADTFASPMAPDDVLLLCTDGLTSHVSAEEIHASCSAGVADVGVDLRTQRWDALATLARERGSRDDITAVSVALRR